MVGTLIIGAFGYGLALIFALATISMFIDLSKSHGDAGPAILGAIITMLIAAFTRWLVGW